MFMHHRGLRAAFLVAALSASAGPAYAADAATLLRVFLKDGTSLVSYGEPARVGSRIVFSMPTASTPNPPLHLVDISLDRVDWDRTERYSYSAREKHYLQTQAESDYASLSTEIAQALNDVAMTPDASKRLDIVQRARKTLAEWPQNHYNYRQAEVHQMLTMLDEAIADLRAAAGANSFDLSLATYTARALTPISSEPLMPPSTPRESIEQVLIAARNVDSAAERVSLLGTALTSLNRDGSSLPAEWVAATKAATTVALQQELRVDRSYRSLTTRIMTVANYRARAADVRGLERLVASIRQRDAMLGARRPDAVASLVTAVEAQLDAARRLQLARDKWAMRAPVLQQYGFAIRPPMDLFASLKPALESIKSLSGSTPASLETLQHASTRILTLIAVIAPPDDLAAAHALLVSAVQLADNAAKIRREATLAGDMARAWDASSAAAGALMLGARARTDILALLRPPQLPQLP